MASTEETLREREGEEAPQIAHYRGLIERVTILNDSSHGGPSSMDVAAAMATTSEVLLLNPDLLTAWNVRRRALRNLLAANDWQAAIQELEFSVATIKVNPKSYGAWHHRQWLVGEALKGAPEGVPIQHELALCAKLLALDVRNCKIDAPRNFLHSPVALVHGWNYRWFLTESFPDQMSLQSEFDFTTQMIYKNFSNYSAWHRRSVLVERMVHQGMPNAKIESIIVADLKLLKAAYFTEPADQSAWFYLRWLLDFAEQHMNAAHELADRELDNIEELLAIEPDAPLALFTWSQLARRAIIKGEDHRKPKLCERLQRLSVLDPMRTNMYQSMLTE